MRKRSSVISSSTNDDVKGRGVFANWIISRDAVMADTDLMNGEGYYAYSYFLLQLPRQQYTGTLLFDWLNARRVVMASVS